MSRDRQEGTPRSSRAGSYMIPRDVRRIVWLSAMAGVLVSSILVASYSSGVKRAFSPGDVASHHTRIDLKCAQCHTEGNAVEALRCERCHDVSGSDRLSQASHVLLGSSDSRKADAAESIACAQCHAEHRGPNFQIAAVDDRECSTCHTSFSSLADHPEFAVVRARATAGVGMAFDHIGHLPKVRDATGASCEACHVQTPDRRAFQPMSFDRSCAGSTCHTPGGVLQRPTGVLIQDLILSPERVPADFRAAPAPQIIQTRPNRIRAERITHRDPWVLVNALRLRRSVDPEGDAAERLALKAGTSYLEQLQRPVRLHQLAPDQLTAGIELLRSEIAEMDRRLAAETVPDDRALADITEATRTIAATLGSLDQSVASEAAAVSTMPTSGTGGTPPATADDAKVRFDRRKAELLAVLASVVARGDPTFAGRAAALKSRVEALTMPAGTSDADSATLIGGLGLMEDSLRALRAIPDPGLQAELDRLDLSRRNAAQRIAAGLTPDEFEQRRAELLSLLEAIERRGDETVQYRVVSLRERIIALQSGIGLSELRRTRRNRQRDLERLVIEQELQQSERDREDPPAQDATLDVNDLDRRARRLRSDLSILERAPRMNLATTADERQDRLDTIRALLEPCEKCHQYDPSGTRMAPVRIAEPVMPRSIFNHAPHTTQTGCETCHGSVLTSKLATDVNVPGVDNCRTCHAPSKAKADCESCHVYHPRSAVTLLRTTP